MSTESSTYYLRPLLNPKILGKIVTRSVNALRKFNAKRKKNNKFNAIAFRGLSGALIAPIIANRLKMPMIAVRKGEDCHSDHGTEAATKMRHFHYVIVDDLISTGTTMEKIKDGVSKVNPDNECVGILLWYSEKGHRDKWRDIPVMCVGHQSDKED